MNSIRYERLGVGDANDIARVHFESWRATYSDILPQGYIDGAMRADIDRVWVDWKPNKLVVGGLNEQDDLVAIATYDMDDEAGQAAYLDNFHVLAPHHGTGLARDLFVVGAKAIADEGAGALWLTVLDTNIRARTFYAKMKGREGALQDDSMLGHKVRSVPVFWDDLGMIEKNNG